MGAHVVTGGVHILAPRYGGQGHRISQRAVIRRSAGDVALAYDGLRAVKSVS